MLLPVGLGVCAQCAPRAREQRLRSRRRVTRVMNAHGIQRDISMGPRGR